MPSFVTVIYFERDRLESIVTGSDSVKCGNNENTAVNTASAVPKSNIRFLAGDDSFFTGLPRDFASCLSGSVNSGAGVRSDCGLDALGCLLRKRRCLLLATVD